MIATLFSWSCRQLFSSPVDIPFSSKPLSQTQPWPSCFCHHAIHSADCVYCLVSKFVPNRICQQQSLFSQAQLLFYCNPLPGVRDASLSFSALFVLLPIFLFTSLFSLHTSHILGAFQHNNPTSTQQLDSVGFLICGSSLLANAVFICSFSSCY